MVMDGGKSAVRFLQFRALSPVSYAVFICCLASLLPIYDFFIQVAPGVMVEGLVETFHQDAASIGLLGAVFYLSYAVFQPPSGYFIDKFGVKTALIAYTFITGLSSIIFSLSNEYYMLILMRMLAGFGVCIAFISGYYLSAKLLPHRYFSLVAAILHFAASIGAMIAQAPLAFMVGKYGWRMAMFGCGICGFILALFFYFLINLPKEESSQREKNSQQHNFINALKVCMHNKQIIWIAVCAFLSWLPVSVIGAVWGIPYLMRIYQRSPVQVSTIGSLFWIGSALGGFILSFSSEWLCKRKTPLIFSFIAASLSGIALVAAPLLPVWFIGLCLFILGISVCVQTMSFVLVKENVSPQYFALASGVNNFISMMSGVLGPHLVGALLVYQSPNSLEYSVMHYQVALLVLPISAIIGLFICWNKINETNCQNQYLGI